MLRLNMLIPFAFAAPVAGAVFMLEDAAGSVGNFTWLNIATSAGFAGLAWYLIVIAWPRERQSHRDELAMERTSREAMVSQFTTELVRAREAFTAALELERVSFDRNLQRIAEASEKQAELHRQTILMVFERGSIVESKPTG